MSVPHNTEQLINLLAQQVSNLTAALQNQNTAKSSMNRPDPFKGDSGADARRFLTHFISWAMEQPDLASNEAKMIKIALGLLTGTAGSWATPYLQQLNIGQTVFNGRWSEFADAFSLRFISIDPEMEAREAIKHIRPGKGQTIAEFAQNFKDVGSRSGLSDLDLREKFNSSLPKEIRRNLMVINMAQGLALTLDDAIKRAISVDTYLRDPTLNDRHYPHTSTSTPPQSTADPYAMDISATRNGNGKTREEFISRMRGRCYGCGAQTHEKRNCPHKETTCRYCSRKGHLEAVCQDRFMGLERNRGKKQSNRRQQVSANTDESFSLFPGEQVQIASSSSAPVNPQSTPPVTSTANLGAQIAQLQQLLDRANAMSPAADF